MRLLHVLRCTDCRALYLGRGPDLVAELRELDALWAQRQRARSTAAALPRPRQSPGSPVAQR